MTGPWLLVVEAMQLIDFSRRTATLRSGGRQR
jgi:hypothetical protein